MGYYTNYTLTQTGCAKRDIKRLEDEIEKLNVFEDGAIEDGLYGYAKWYDYDIDMRLLSRRFPGVVFYLEGDGENSDDLWGNYYMDGRAQYGALEVVEYPFDEAQLDKKPFVDDGQPYSYEIRAEKGS